MATTWPGCCYYCYCCAFKICCLLLQDYLRERAELQNIQYTMFIFNALCVDYSLELSRETCLLSTYYYYIYTYYYYLLVFENDYIFWIINCPRHQASVCMYHVCILTHHFKIEISLIPGQMLGALFTSANIHTYWQLAVGKTL